MINRIVLIGRITADPELKYTQSGVAVASFSLAVERNFKNSQGEKVTDFINCVAWRKTAELIGEYVKKGKLLGVDGSLQMRKYQTQEGQQRTVYEVLVDSVQFIGDRQTGNQAENTQDAQPSTEGNYPEDDLPF